MLKKFLCVSIVIFGCIIQPVAYAAEIGALLGIGRYWIENSGATGFALNGFLDLGITQNLSAVPTFGIWTGSEDGTNIFELNPSFALRIVFPAGTVKPYVGIDPELHIFFVEGETLTRFGFSGLGGLNISLAEHLILPIQMGYGKFFYEDGSTNSLTLQIGLALKL